MFALFAGVQREPTLGTISDRIGQVLQESSALGATRDGAGSGHLERTGSESIFSFCGGWFFEFFLRLAGGILVSALPILAVGQRVPPEKLPHSALLARLAQVALSWGAGRTNGFTAMWPRLAALNRAARVFVLIYCGFARKVATLLWIPPSKS